MTNLTIGTNDEISINGKRLGWIMTYNQAKTKGMYLSSKTPLPPKRAYFGL